MQVFDGVKMYPIPGFDGYMADENGNIWSCLKVERYSKTQSAQINTGVPRRKLKPSPRAEDGRGRVTIRSSDGKLVRRYVSNFVLLATSGPRPSSKHEACHCDGNCLNDRPDNLRWDTRVANKADMAVHGTRQRGEQINTNKLTEGQVREILLRFASGAKLKELSQEYGVSMTSLSSIRNRKTWRHVSV